MQPSRASDRLVAPDSTFYPTFPNSGSRGILNEVEKTSSGGVAMINLGGLSAGLDPLRTGEGSRTSGAAKGGIPIATDSPNWLQRFENSLRSGVNWLTQTLLLPPQSTLTSRRRVMQLAWMGGLYVFGLVVLSFFLHWGAVPFGVHDWGQEWAFDTTLQQALRQGILPLHTSVFTYSTDRFLAIPQTILSPQVLLLRFMDLGPFLLVHALILFTVGFLGSLALAKHLKLSPIVGGALFLLVAFNGHVVSQVAVGHVMWLGIYLLPVFFLLLLRLLDGQEGRLWPLAMAITLFFLLLQGSIHLYVWCLIFLGVMWIVDGRHRRRVFEAALLSGLFGAFRLLPAGLVFSEPSATAYPGYPSLAHVIIGLAFPLPPSEQLSLSTSAGWWEFDMYVGVLGLLWAVVFGVIAPARRGTGSRGAIYAAAVVMGLFALGYFYLPLRLVPIPLISNERVPSRFLILALLVAIIAGSEKLQQWLDRVQPGPGARVGVLVLFLVLAQDLVQHARMWRVELVGQAFPAKALDVSLHIVNRADPAYTGVLLIGALISLAAFAYGFFRVLQQRSVGR